jgi:hypothetical protein
MSLARIWSGSLAVGASKPRRIASLTTIRYGRPDRRASDAMRAATSSSRVRVVLVDTS